MKVEGALKNLLSAHTRTVLINVLKLSLDEVRELSSGSKKFLESIEFTLECSLDDKRMKKKEFKNRKTCSVQVHVILSSRDPL